jgi:hypothetical protein
MKNLTLNVNDVVKLSKGDEMIEVVFTRHYSGKKTGIGIADSLDWKIELFRNGKAVEGATKRKS